MNFDNPDPEDDDRKRDSSRKRDGKKEKKDKGYQMFEEEDSEDDHSMSPSKAKIGRGKPSFKFPAVRKEKTKEKDDKKEEKEKKKEEKEGKKIKKDKKKSKHSKSTEIVIPPTLCENPIFGVPLAVAVERNKSHDGIEVPAIVRECIDYIEECGLSCEGIYRISGVKSKVQHLKDAYNKHEPVYLYEHEPNVVASLLKQFLRELPEMVLTNFLLPKFEEASVIKNNKKKVEAFQRLINELPTCNRLLLSWMIVHMSHVIELAKENKMSIQNVSIVLSPTMQISHRVLYVLFSNVTTLFGNVTLRKYVPPLKPAHSKWSLELPDNVISLEEELAKQESLLHDLHEDLNTGLTDPVKEEQLWEVQRVVTQLKRKIKTAKKNVERKANVDMKRSSQTSIPSLSAPEELQLGLRTVPTQSPGRNQNTVTAVIESHTIDDKDEATNKTSGKEEETKKSIKTTVKDKDEDNTISKQNEKKNDTGCLKSSEITAKSVVADNNLGEDDKSKDPPSASSMVNNKTSNDQSKENLKKEEPVTPSSDSCDESRKKENFVDDKKTVEETESKTPTPEDSDTLQEERPSDLPILRKDVKPAERPPSITGQKMTPSPPGLTSPVLVKDVILPQKTVKLPESAILKKSSVSEIKEESHSNESLSKQKTETEPKKPSLPPFMSTVLLQPMKADIPRPKSYDDEKTDEESQLRWEKLRELEEELLGEKKKKALSGTESDWESDVSETDDEKEKDLEQLLEEEYALQMEDEELLAIADELKQKMATELSEMERLRQELQEVAYLRHDSDLEEMSDTDNSSDDSEDEDDLHDILTTLIQENQDMEMQNSELCNKIHEERMICLSVKLQIRLLQQRQAENVYG